MRMNDLGRTGLKVSELCLGTMTWGTQTDVADAHAQIARAQEAGINFMDTAEMYPTNPVRAETIGGTEEIIGQWIAAGGDRQAWIIATKHSGEGSMCRDGAPISPQTIPATIEASLKRLRTDVIDLYQFHWPNRGSPHFRKNWTYDPLAKGMGRAAVLEDMAACLEALQSEVDRGTIRHFGLSNETAWGTAQWLRLSEAGHGPRVASIQNEYGLMCRLADTDLQELLIHEDVGLLPYSPLAAGLLTGKYQGGAVPDGSRMSATPNLGGRVTDRAFAAVGAYAQVARDFGLDLAQMALAWSARRPFVASSILGASSLAQLDHLLGAAELALSDELLAALDAVHKAHPMPF